MHGIIAQVLAVVRGSYIYSTMSTVLDLDL